MKKRFNQIKIPGRWLIVLGAMLLIIISSYAQNVTIYNWTPPGVNRSVDVRIRPASFITTDYFDTAIPEEVNLIKNENFIYVRFRNNTPSDERPNIILNGTVTVTAVYAETDAGVTGSDLIPKLTEVTTWKPYGSYTMNLVPDPGDDPMGFGLLPGDDYPTPREDGDPSLYRIPCSIDCNMPLPTSFFLRITVTMAGDTNLSDNVSYSYYDITGGVVPPSDVVILHDVSGSMSSEIDVAKERAKMFVDLLNKGDRVGVVAFSTALNGDTKTLASLNGIGTNDPSDLAKTFAKSGIDSFWARGGTPMGSGVIKAQEVLNAIPSPHANRAIIMLTDGKENQPPNLKDPPLYPILDGLNTDAKGAIGLYPLWFGTLSHWGKTLLEDITTQVDVGKVVDQPTDDLKLAEAYLMIRGILTSDDIYAIHRGVTGDSYEGAIHVDNVTDELILTVAWQSFERELEIEVMPPGTESWLPASSRATATSNGRLYGVHRFENPTNGQWKYRLSGARNGQSAVLNEESYVLAALADVVETLMQSSLENTAVSAGQPIIINAKLSNNGEAVPGATVHAIVETPDRALGTILNDYRGQFKTPFPVGTNSEVTRATGIIQELQQFLNSDKILTYGTQTITLTDENGDGVYTGQFENTRIAGTYDITIIAESTVESPGEGFLREHHHAAIVSLGTIDSDKSIVDISFQDYVGSQGDAVYRMNVIPVDIYGNYADPGYSSRIQVDADQGTWTKALADNADGSYTRFLQVEKEKNPQVTVSAFGQPVKKQTVSESGSAKNWHLSLHAGTVQPTGSFDDIVNRGSSFTLDLGYHFNPNFSGLLFVGNHNFPREVEGDESIWQISSNLRGQLSGRKLTPYLQAGPGVYQIFENWEFGMNAGVGLVYPASSSVDVEGGLDYHNIFLDSDDASFWQFHLGFSIKF